MVDAEKLNPAVVEDLVPEVVTPTPTLFSLTVEYPAEWSASVYNAELFAKTLRDKGIITESQRQAYLTETRDYVDELRRKVAAPETFKEKIGLAIWNKIHDYLVPAFEAVLKSIWKWIRETFADWWDSTQKYLIPPIKEALSWLNAQVDDLSRRTYQGLIALMQESGPITPELAPGLALKIYGFAWGMGMAAHVGAVGLELIHPLKNMGLNQIPAMLGDFAGFGRIAAATMGVYTSIALAQPMKYAVSNLTRSLIPDDRLLRIMAVKPDITIETFRKNMAYQGYSEFWIDKIQRTMFSEPRYFELKMLAEDEKATEDWLFTKVRRAGYTEKDSEVFVSSFIKAATRTPRMDYYRQAFYLFKEGYIGEDDFDKLLDDLELRPEAYHFSKRAAELAYMLDLIKDKVAYWHESYKEDLISEDELRLHLTMLGIPLVRADVMVKLAKVKKYKNPAAAEKRELESLMNQVRSKYSSAYIALYRKDAIDAKTLEANLIRIGIVPDLAAATVALEAAKKFTPAAPS